MGKMEQENKKRVRKTRLQEAVLTTIFSGGYKSSSLIPEILNSALGLELSTSLRKKEVTKSAVNRLIKKGLVALEHGRYALTKSGRAKLDEWNKARYHIKNPKKWDGKWRVVIFDIPENKRGARRQIASILKETGFERLQDSVWVYPYDCEDIIGLLKTDFGIGKELLYIIADQIENDKYLRMDFGLL